MPCIHDIAKESDPINILMKYIKILSEYTKRNTIIYYSGWLSANDDAVGINDFDKNGFMSVIHGLDVGKGLDLILHTPGGEVSATESIIDYLYEIFGGNIRAVVPQLAMSGGTMIACSCKEIIMGKQSSLGPIDPQFGEGIPAHGIIEEFEKAKKEVKNDPSTIPIWQPIISKYPPTFVGKCYKAIDWSEEILCESLKRCMFKNLDEDEATEKIEKIKEKIGSHEDTKAHDRHLNPQKCKDMGLIISMMEEDNTLQDNILSVHHACIDLMSKKPIAKVIMNNNDKIFIQQISN